MAITLKKLIGDTEVLANPVLDGTETALSGLQIDGVKYAMGGGTLKMKLLETINVSTGSSVQGNINLKGKIVMVSVDSFSNGAFFYVNQEMYVNEFWYYPLDRLCDITGTSPEPHERKLYFKKGSSSNYLYARVKNNSTTAFTAEIYELVVE